MIEFKLPPNLPYHYWQIHRKVCKNLFGKLDTWTQTMVANGGNHISSWFSNKTLSDAMDLFLSDSYWYNQIEVFQRDTLKKLYS